MGTAWNHPDQPFGEARIGVRMKHGFGDCIGRRFGWFACLVFLSVALANTAHAIPQLVDWDDLVWLPEGPSNLDETFLIDGRDVSVTFSGNVSGLANDPPRVSPRIDNSSNNGGLMPPEQGLVITTDYAPGDTNRSVTVTIDFSMYPGGISNASYSIFDVDQNSSFVDIVTMTATVGGVEVDPTSITVGPSNILTSPNTVEGRVFSVPGSANGNVTTNFAVSGITALTINYRNGGPTNNAGLQTITLHDIAYAFNQADIRLEKTIDNATPSVTDNVVYTITATNDGPDTGTGLVVTDQLPAGVTYVSDDSGGAYDPGTGQWLVGTLAPAASATLLITAQVNFAGPYDNIAELTAANEFDPDSTPGNNDPNEDDQDNASLVPTVFADLSLTKTVDNAEPLVGDNIVYTVTVTNGGPLDTTGVTVTDMLPSGLQYVADVPSAGSYANATGVWTIGALANGASATLQITAQVLATGDYTNVAEVTTSDFPDPDSTPGNNDPTEDDQASATIAPPAIGVAKSVSAGPVNNGDGTFSFSYDIIATNVGTVDLNNFQVTDDLAATFAGAISFVVDGVTSLNFSDNAGYDGSADVNLLQGTDVLGVGQSAVITVAVTLTPGANLGPYLNTAIGSGVGPGGTPVSDLSQSGVNPDPDGDGDPTNNNDPTPLSVGENPAIGLSKRVTAAPVNNGDGSFTFVYSFVVQNFGDVELDNIQIVDNLAQSFTGSGGFAVNSITSGDFAVNNAFDGNADTALLAGTDSLALGASGEVQVLLTVTTGGNLGPYNNTANAGGISPAGTPVSDVSTDGVSTDPDNDGDPGNNSTPTPVSFTEFPQIGMAKRVSAGPINNGDGTFSFAYEILVNNSGDVALSNVQITDDLATAFGAADSYTVNNVISASLTVNTGFDGDADQNLLLGMDSLAVGASGRVFVEMTVTPGANLGPYNNTAVGAGTSPVGTVVTDSSTDGIDPDPTNNGDPGDDNTPTPITFGENPGIGTAKVVSTQPVDNNNGTFTFAYTIRVANTGDVVLSNLQVVEDLATVFAAASGFAVNAIQSADFAVNGAFNGASDTALLAGTDTLGLNSSGDVTLTLTVTPGAFAGPYLNTALGQGTSPADSVVEDPSTNGTSVDPDNDGDPGNNSEPTPITFATPLLVVTKAAEPRQAIAGQMVRYTVTVENQGGSTFVDLTLVDLIPAGFTYVSGSERLSNGTPVISGERPVNFAEIDVAPGERVTLNYILRVGAGVVRGNYPNVVTPTRQGQPVGEPATAVVQVIGNPDVDETTVIGMVFADHNLNGIQDEGEYGIPGVRLATVEGLVIETDAYGRYHIAGVDGGFTERGRNFIVKVDPQTLPDGAVFSTENPRVLRITGGLMNRIDFGIGLPGAKRERLYPIHVKLTEVFFKDNSDKVAPEFEAAFSELAARLVAHGGGKLFISGNDPADCRDQSPDGLSTKVETEDFVFVPQFGVRKAELTPQDRAALADLVARWQGAGDVSLTSIGHTSSVRIAPQNRHEFADNYVLGEARARTVANYLRDALNLSDDQMTIESRGPDEPVASNDTFEGRAQNRRVELSIKGRRVIQEVVPGESRACDSQLAQRRANNVYEKLRQYMGDCSICDVEVIVTGP